jgi:hypothetical protein
MAFNDFDVEIQNEKDSKPEHINGSVTFAGTPITVTAGNGLPIQSALIICPNKGPNANSKGTYLLVSSDGTANYTTVPRGGKLQICGVFDNLTIDASDNNTNYEIIITQSK